jgi:hypothetical protein
MLRSTLPDGNRVRERRNLIEGGVMMIALRFLALVAFSSLLTACGGTLCPEPHEPKFENHTPCWYSFLVTDVKKVDDTKLLVTGTIPPNVGDKDTDHSKPYSFFVNHPRVETLIPKAMGKDPYLFIGSEHSPYLELYVIP